MSTPNGKANPPEQYVLTFRNGALDKLKELAKRYNISEDNLDTVVEKALKVLELPDDNKLTFNKGGASYFVDLKDL